MIYDPLIFGKNKQEKIVNIEIEDNFATLFIQNGFGGVDTQVVPHTYWMLSPTKLGNIFSPLEGNQHYKYITEFDNKKEFNAKKGLARSKQTDIYMIYDERDAFMTRHGYTYYKNLKIQDLSILSLDIETNGLTRDRKSLIYTIGNAFRKNGVVERKLFSIDEYESEYDMYQDWMKWVVKKDPSIILGHNLFMFDLPFLRHCIEKSGLSFDIGRNGEKVKFNSYPSKFRKDGSQAYEYENVRIFGREIIDSMFLSYKYDIARNFDSYGLKAIVKHLGLEKKDRTFIDASQINQLWKNLDTRQLIKDYNLDDADDALKLFDVMAPSYFYWCQSVPQSFQNVINKATGSQVNSMLVRSYLQNNFSIAKEVYVPKKGEPGYVEGGISFAVPGVYSYLEKFDIRAAYPSQILRFKMYDTQKDPKKHLYYITKYFTEQRIENKRLGKETNDQYYKDMEQSQKIGINSIYGTLNTPGLNYNSPKLAGKITYETREIINKALLWASGKNVDYWINLFEERTKDV